MDIDEAISTEPKREKKKGYKLYIRIIALVLVVLMIVSATSIDFSVLKYAGSDSMEAANYLLEHTNFLTENRYQRLVSLLTNFSSYEISMQAADSAIGKSDYEKAAKYLVKCSGMAEAEEQLPELYVRLGCVYMLDEKLEESKAAFDKSIALAPESAEAYLLRAQVLANTGDTQGADEDCKKYMELGGTDEDMLSVAASVAEYAGDYDTALDALELLLPQAVNDNQRAGYYAEQGRYKYLQGKDVLAAALIEKAKNLDSDALDGVHFAILALDEMNKGQYAQAAEDFRTAGKRADSDRAGYYEQAIVCAYLLQDNALVLDISAEAESAGEMTAQSYMLTGVTAFTTGDYKKGNEAITACLNLDADTGEARYYRGLCRMQLQDYQSAVEDFTESIARDEDAIQCYYNRGLCLMIQAKYEQAVTDLAYVIDDGTDQELAQAAYELLEPLIVQ